MNKLPSTTRHNNAHTHDTTQHNTAQIWYNCLITSVSKKPDCRRYSFNVFQRTHDAILTLLLRQNNVGTSFWRNGGGGGGGGGVSGGGGVGGGWDCIAYIYIFFIVCVSQIRYISIFEIRFFITIFYIFSHLTFTIVYCNNNRRKILGVPGAPPSKSALDVHFSS